MRKYKDVIIGILGLFYSVYCLLLKNISIYSIIIALIFWIFALYFTIKEKSSFLASLQLMTMFVSAKLLLQGFSDLTTSLNIFLIINLVIGIVIAFVIIFLNRKNSVDKNRNK